MKIRNLLLITAAASALLLTGCASIMGAGSDTPRAERVLTQNDTKEKLKDFKDDREAGLRLARMLLSQGRIEGALGVYAEADRKGILDAAALLEYAEAAALIEPPRATLSLFVRAQQAVNAQDVKLTDQQRAALFTGLGRAYLAVSRLQEAETALNEAVKADPKNVSAQNALGVLLDARGDHKKAQAAFDAALAVNPTNVDVLNNLGLSKLASGDTKGAMKTLRDAVNFSDKRSMNAVTASMNLAFVQYLSGRRKTAETTLAAFMGEDQVKETTALFKAVAARAKTGETTLTEEWLASAGKIIQIRAKGNAGDDYGYEVPAVIEPVKVYENRTGGLSERAKTYPAGEAPVKVQQLQDGK